MIPQLFVESIDLGDGRNITIETGRLAKQADGSVVVRIGKTVILGTVVSARKASPGFTLNGRLHRENLLQQVVFLEVSSKEKHVQVTTKY
jgi:ribonuclease PH